MKDRFTLTALEKEAGQFSLGCYSDVPEWVTSQYVREYKKREAKFKLRLDSIDRAMAANCAIIEALLSRLAPSDNCKMFLDKNEKLRAEKDQILSWLRKEMAGFMQEKYDPQTMGYAFYL